MKKKVLFVWLIFFLILISPFIFAEQDKIDKAYSCLKEKIADKTCLQLSTTEKIFTSLALGECRSELLEDSTSEGCWPASNCNLKTTAQATLSLRSTTAKEWILNQKAIPLDITWYLQIETPQKAVCTITYDRSDYIIEVGDDKKIDSNAGDCLSLSPSRYWLEISPDCYEKEFEISCDQSFLTNLLFKSSASSTIHVSEKTSSVVADGTTVEKVNSFCFANSGECDYEGSLWATLALNSLGEDVSQYIPYLITNANENQEYFPEIFLYALTGYNDFKYDIFSKQTSNGYWSFSGDKYYDTALALYPFSYEDFSEKQNAMKWLIEQQQQDGCWNSDNILDTSFILHSVWPRQVSENKTGISCSDIGYYCMSQISCANSGGNILDYDCSTFYVCCDTPEIQETCEELNGEICSGGKVCAGETMETSTTYYCCFDGCVEPSPVEDSCYSNNGVCEPYECGKGYEINYDFSCDNNEICCLKKAKEGPKPLFWILLVLVFLITLAIIFKDKLKEFWFRIKSNFRKSPPPGRGPRRPGFSPPPLERPSRRIMPRRIIPIEQKNISRQPLRQPRKSSELDDVLKKLKEMGK